jgi:polyphosphate kinase
MPTVGAARVTADSDLGSADLMPRNLNRRVEVVFPVRAPKLIRHLRDEVLATYLSDVVKGATCSRMEVMCEARIVRIQRG